MAEMTTMRILRPGTDPERSAVLFDRRVWF
jgi:hypothetical protein